ncbi:hypothetical protein V5O48_016866 [Marasmius crinis-equi]|uniref:Uncharacterized protein n=1 Tax=Marasmius crinis-equi TaxID=585013 RepID=A0ABR3EQJ6_9AGAR
MVARQRMKIPFFTSSHESIQACNTVPNTKRLQAFIRLLSLLLHKRKRFRDEVHLHTTPYRSIAYSVVIEAVECCRDVMVNEVVISDALDFGILAAIIKADSLYFSPDLDQDQPLRQPGKSFTRIIVGIIDSISRFLIYSPILHRVLRSLRAMPDLDRWEDKLKLESPKAWSHWRDMKERAQWVYEIRRELGDRERLQLTRCMYEKAGLDSFPE